MATFSILRMTMSDQASFGENQGHADSTQPKPEQTSASQSVTDAVIEDLRQRREHGIGKYGIELLTFNGRDVLLDIYQEQLDALLYTKQALMERDAYAAKKGQRREAEPARTPPAVTISSSFA